ncbi:MAG: maltose phosphorylase, partial [Lachnospiraceae bacterium]|nr:maltose phosphorylase [Lachnospiraceae bacterium]
MLKEFCNNKYGRDLSACSNEEIYVALLEMTKELSKNRVSEEGKKKIYYISAEFLIGKLLSNNLINLGVFADVKAELEAAGKSI